MAKAQPEERSVKDAVLFTLEAERSELENIDTAGDPEMEAAECAKLAKELEELSTAVRELPAGDSLFNLLAKTWEGWDLDTDPATGEDESWVEHNPYGPLVLQGWREWGQEGEELSEFIPWLRNFLRRHKPGQLWEEYRNYMEQQTASK